MTVTASYSVQRSPGEGVVQALALAVGTPNPASPAPAIDALGSSTGQFYFWAVTEGGSASIVFGPASDVRDPAYPEMMQVTDTPQCWVLDAVTQRYFRALAIGESGVNLHWVSATLAGGDPFASSPPWLVNGLTLLRNGAKQLVNG